MLNNVPESDNFSYDSVASVIAKTATSLLSKKERAQAGWFKGNETVLLPLMKSHKSAMADVFKRQTLNVEKSHFPLFAPIFSFFQKQPKIPICHVTRPPDSKILGFQT